MSTNKKVKEANAIGRKWQSKLEHVEYDTFGRIASHEYFSSPNVFGGENVAYEIPEKTSILCSKIISARILIHNLGSTGSMSFFKLFKQYDIFSKHFTHHFIAAVTESGYQFTIEKVIFFLEN